eukprot:2952716-Pyramimonas_sp.AAC.1
MQTTASFRGTRGDRVFWYTVDRSCTERQKSCKRLHWLYVSSSLRGGGRLGASPSEGSDCFQPLEEETLMLASPL